LLAGRIPPGFFLYIQAEMPPRVIPESGSRKPVLALHDLLLFFVNYMIMLMYASDSLEV